MRKVLGIFLYGCLLLAGAVAGAPAETNTLVSEPSSSYVVTSWHIQNGLPSDRVRAVLQTRDSYIWVATFNGIARFDGVRFERFNDANTPELRNSLANSLFEDSAGRLWVGSDTGEITWRDSKGFHPLAAPTNWPNVPVDRFAQAADGTLYALGRNGLILAARDCKYLGIVGEASKKHYSEVTSDNEGRVWAVQYGGILQRLSGLGQTADSPAPVARMYRNAVGALQGGIWVRDGPHVRRWYHGQWVEDRGVHSWTTQRGVVMHENAAGELWIGTVNDGAFIVARDGTEQHINRSTGLENDLVSSIITDEEGNTWVGTDGGGLHLLRHRALSMVNPPDRWQNRAVLSVAPAAPDGLWVGTEGAGVYRLQDGKFTTVQSPGPAAAQDIRAVWQTRSGQIWAGTQGAGLFSGRPETSLAQVKGGALIDGLKLYYAFYEDRNGALWMGTQDGLVKYDGQWSRLGTNLVLSEVRCITEAPDGAIWAGLRGGGLARYQNGEFIQLRGREGPSYDIIWCLYADTDSTLWIGTPGAGLIRWRNGLFSSFTTRDGLPSDFICNIQADNSGHLWIGSYAGIFQIEKKCLEQRANGGDEPLRYILLDMDDGLTSLEIAGGNQPSACSTPDGRLWYATSAGLAVVDPTRIKPNRKAPPVRIEQVLVDGKPVASDSASSDMNASLQQLTVPPGGGSIEIRYTALSFSKPQGCRFRYRLEPSDAHWVDAGERRSSYYTRLPPKQYRFHVIACNSDGVWNTDGALISFVVLPFFWEKWWFVPLCWVTGLSACAAFVLAAVRQHHRRRVEALLRARLVERERVRIARDLHDDLGSGLTDINMTSALGKDPSLSVDEARDYFREISECSTEMVSALDEIVWAVNPKNDDLNALTTYFCQFAERYLKPAHISCRFQIPKDLPVIHMNAEQRHNLFLAFKESLQNAVKHSGCSNLRFSVSAEAETLRMEVEDNGRGFIEGPPEPGADGLQNMRERLEQIGGKCEISSEPGRGTRVVFILPLALPPARRGSSRSPFGLLRIR